MNVVVESVSVCVIEYKDPYSEGTEGNLIENTKTHDQRRTVNAIHQLRSVYLSCMIKICIVWRTGKVEAGKDEKN